MLSVAVLKFKFSLKGWVWGLIKPVSNPSCYYISLNVSNQIRRIIVLLKISNALYNEVINELVKRRYVS